MAKKPSAEYTIRFTTLTLDKLPSPAKGFITYTDSECKYLKLYVTANGAKSFFVNKKVKGRTRRIIIGPHPVFSVEMARKEALVLCAMIVSGKDPSEEKRRERLDKQTFGGHFREYLERHSKLRKRSWRYDENEVNLHLSHWFNLRLSDITRIDVQKLHEKIGAESGVSQANKLVARIRAIYNKAIEWGWVGTNPALSIERFKEHSRDRFIQPSEMRLFLMALEEEPCQTFQDFFKILLLTGVRKTNALMMRWDQVNWDRYEWRIPHTKNGDPLLIPLVEQAIEILRRRKASYEGPWVFPQETDPKKHIFTPRKSWENMIAKATLWAWHEDDKLSEWLNAEEKKFVSYLSPANKLRRLTKEAAKLELETPHAFKDLRIHDIRRTFGSYQALTGASLPIIGRSLGHKSSQSTQIYARLNLDPVRESVEKAVGVMLG